MLVTLFATYQNKHKKNMGRDRDTMKQPSLPECNSSYIILSSKETARKYFSVLFDMMWALWTEN